MRRERFSENQEKKKRRALKMHPARVLIAGLVFFLVLTLPVPAQAATKVTKLTWKNSYEVHTVAKGKKFRFRVKVTPTDATNKKIRFASSNPKVASVSKNGTVKGKKKGKAVIVAVAGDGSGRTVKCTVYVGKKAKKVAWKNASSKKTIAKGKSFNFNTKVTPVTAACKRVKYTTSNKKIATVTKNGVVKGKKNGTVTIRARAKDGSGKSVTCKVTVVTKVTKVTLSNTVSSMLIGDTHTMKATISPSGASNKNVTWSSSKTSVAKVSSAGLVTAVGTGTTTITAKAADGSGKKASIKVKVTNPLAGVDIPYVAHRGLSAEYPENTVQSFRAAASDSGFSGVECDIWEVDRTDGSGKDIMVLHDSTTERVCNLDISIKTIEKANRGQIPITGGNGNLSSVTYLIPTLQEYLQSVKNSGKMMYIELKDSALSEEGAETILDIIEDEQVSADRIHFISFYKKSLVQVRDLAKERGMEGMGFRYLISSNNTAADVLAKIQTAQKSDMDSVGVTQALTTAVTVQAAKEAGLSYHVWTVDDPAKAKKFADMGCDSITTNCRIWAK